MCFPAAITSSTLYFAISLYNLWWQFGRVTGCQAGAKHGLYSITAKVLPRCLAAHILHCRKLIMMQLQTREFAYDSKNVPALQIIRQELQHTEQKLKDAVEAVSGCCGGSNRVTGGITRSGEMGQLTLPQACNVTGVVNAIGGRGEAKGRPKKALPATLGGWEGMPLLLCMACAILGYWVREGYNFMTCAYSSLGGREGKICFADGGIHTLREALSETKKKRGMNDPVATQKVYCMHASLTWMLH